MHRAFSLRRHKSQPRVSVNREPSIPEGKEDEQDIVPGTVRSLSRKLLRRGHSRSHSDTYGDGSSIKTRSENALVVPGAGEFPQRSLSRREKIVKVIANPDTLFVRDPSSPPPESRLVSALLVQSAPC